MRLPRLALVFASLLPLAVSPAMADTEALGLSARARVEFSIPKGVEAPTYVLPPGHLVRADSLAVSSGREKWRLSPFMMDWPLRILR